MLPDSLTSIALWVGAAGIGLGLLWRVRRRLQLSFAKHPSLQGHGRIARRLARQVPHYEYEMDEALGCDGADTDVVKHRRKALAGLATRLRMRHARSLAQSASLKASVSDAQFVAANRIPYQFRKFADRLQLPSLLDSSDGVRVRDLDGNWYYDASGSYGVNLFGTNFYKSCIAEGSAKVRSLGPILGAYHPVVAENVNYIREISGQDEVSFHMSGTEAVMQAVRLARFHTRRSQIVMFCGAYHGWWDGVQSGIGHRRSLDDVYLLRDMSERSLNILRTRKDIAGVLINPLQALHPNQSPSSDATLINSDRSTNFDLDAYCDWIKQLRAVCTEQSIPLIFDEVFVGFRLGLGGAQALFGVQADMVTYGKTIGGGLPVGVLTGQASLMKRYRDDRPADLCFARGTFNSHPYVMGSMNAFLRHVTDNDVSAQMAGEKTVWDARAEQLNARLAALALPVRVANFSSIWSITYSRVGRFNWLLQYYLRDSGIYLSWVGSGRLIFSHNYSDEEFRGFVDAFVDGVQRMQDDGWWSAPDTLTNRSIKRQILREMLRARFASGIPAESPTLAPADRAQP